MNESIEDKILNKSKKCGRVTGIIQYFPYSSKPSFNELLEAVSALQVMFRGERSNS